MRLKLQDTLIPRSQAQAVVTQPLSLAFSLTRLPLMHDFMQIR
jgi:hypothetical protein